MVDVFLGRKDSGYLKYSRIDLWHLDKQFSAINYLY